MSKRMSKVAEQRDPAIKRIIDAFHKGHLDRHGFAVLRPDWGRFAKEVQQVLASTAEAQILDLMAEFFASTDPRVLRSDYRPMDFINLLQHLQLCAKGRRVDGRTAENMDAAHRASGRR